MDLNHDKVIQSHLCYRYTIGQDEALRKLNTFTSQSSHAFDSASRFHVVPNGCDPADFDGLTPGAPSPAGKFVLLHAGSLYGARNPAPLIAALTMELPEPSGRLAPAPVLGGPVRKSP